MGKVILLTIGALILAAVVITLLIWLVFVVRSYFSADRAEARRLKNELEDKIDELGRAEKRADKL